MLRRALRQDSERTIGAAADYIRQCQLQNGAIPWYTGGKLDPWDHVEAAMGLTIAGDTTAAKRAFAWLAEHQNRDGSWFAKYCGDLDDGDNDRNKVETNFVAYPACGLWHYLLISGDQSFIAQYFPVIERAIDYIVTLQGPEGEIQWAQSRVESLPQDALITACSSILRSLECALHLAHHLESPKPHWRIAYHRLKEALRHKPWRFDRTWAPKTRFSMDWFYPVLAGIYSPREAQSRLASRWQEFVEPGVGCRCVSDEPWMTVAESCELTIALVAAGLHAQAEEIFRPLLRWQDKDGGFWTGYSFRDKVIWPEEKTTWTAAAVILAADALENRSAASGLFTTGGRVND